jgi:hypothetical protein
MNPVIGWILAAIAVALAWRSYGWQGVAFAGSLVVFWLVLQFNRSVRVMKNASNAPVGRVGSAVTLHSKLTKGMTLIQILPLTKSLGRKMSDAPETWQWADEGGSSVTAVFDKGRLQSWTLHRPEQPPEDAAAAP